MEIYGMGRRYVEGNLQENLRRGKRGRRIGALPHRWFPRQIEKTHTAEAAKRLPPRCLILRFFHVRILLPDARIDSDHGFPTLSRST